MVFFSLISHFSFQPLFLPHLTPQTLYTVILYIRFVVRILVIIMVRIEMGDVKIQPRKAGGFMVTLPIAIAKALQIKDGETLKVFMDIEQNEIIYRLESEKKE